MQDVFDRIKVVLERTTLLTDGCEVGVHAFGHIFLERARTIVADLGSDLFFTATRAKCRRSKKR